MLYILVLRKQVFESVHVKYIILFRVHGNTFRDILIMKVINFVKLQPVYIVFFVLSSVYMLSSLIYLLQRLCCHSFC